MSAETDVIFVCSGGERGDPLAEINAWLEEKHHDRLERGWNRPNALVATGCVNYLDREGLVGFVREMLKDRTKFNYPERVQLFLRHEYDDYERGFHDVLTPRRADGFPEASGG